MDHNEVFEAEAEIEAYNSSKRRQRPSASSSKGPDAVTSTLGERERIPHRGRAVARQR